MRVTAETKLATRQRILDAAQQQFRERGFDATTTRDIARTAQIASGTLFNYFPTKESIVECLVREACSEATEALNSAGDNGQELSLEEDLFAHVALVLRKLKPLRKYLPAVLETTLSPLARDSAKSDAAAADQPSLRTAHLETVSRIVFEHGHGDVLSSVALQLYWTLYTGVLAFWAKDASPRQEDTLALLDQSLAMFVGWLTSGANQAEFQKAGG